MPGRLNRGALQSMETKQRSTLAAAVLSPQLLGHHEALLCRPDDTKVVHRDCKNGDAVWPAGRLQVTPTSGKVERFCRTGLLLLFRRSFLQWNHHPTSRNNCKERHRERILYSRRKQPDCACPKDAEAIGAGEISSKISPTGLEQRFQKVAIALAGCN